MFGFVKDLKNNVKDNIQNNIDKITGKEEKKGVDVVSHSASHIDLVKEKRKLGFYYDKFEQPINSTRFQNTYLCKHLDTGEYRCLKVLSKKTVSKDFFWAEVETYKQLVHPNILHLYETIEDKNNYYFVLDRLDRPNLYEAIPKIFKKANEFDEVQVALVMRVILKTLMFCHGKEIVHSALTYQDILLDPEKGLQSLYICGFGYARLNREYRLYHHRSSDRSLKPNSSSFRSDHSSARSQPSIYNSDSGLEDDVEHSRQVEAEDLFAAPETRTGDLSVFGEPSDVWSAGVICYQLLSRRNPFEEKDIWPINYRDEEWKKNHFATEPVLQHLSEEAKDIVSQMLTYKPEERPTAAEALQHPWFKCCEREGNRIDKDALYGALTNLSNFHANTKLEQVTRMYIVNNLLSADDRHQLDACFRYMDKNRNNVITRDELRNALRKTRPKDKVVRIETMLEDIFDRIDVQKTGEIDYSEFLAAAADDSVLLTREHLLTTFNAFDKSKTGTITVDDLKRLFNDGQKQKVLHSRDARKLIAKVDLTGDGEINFEEFCHLMHAEF